MINWVDEDERMVLQKLTSNLLNSWSFQRCSKMVLQENKKLPSWNMFLAEVYFKERFWRLDGSYFLRFIAKLLSVIVFSRRTTPRIFFPWRRQMPLFTPVNTLTFSSHNPSFPSKMASEASWVVTQRTMGMGDIHAIIRFLHAFLSHQFL